MASSSPLVKRAGLRLDSPDTGLSPRSISNKSPGEAATSMQLLSLTGFHPKSNQQGRVSVDKPLNPRRKEFLLPPFQSIRPTTVLRGRKRKIWHDCDQYGKPLHQKYNLEQHLEEPTVYIYPQAEAIKDGVTYPQHRQFSQKPSCFYSEADQWHSTWYSLFPEPGHPTSMQVNYGLGLNCNNLLSTILFLASQVLVGRLDKSINWNLRSIRLSEDLADSWKIQRRIIDEPHVQSVDQKLQGLKGHTSNAESKISFASSMSHINSQKIPNRNELLNSHMNMGQECTTQRTVNQDRQSVARNPHGYESRQTSPTNYASSQTNTEDSEKELLADNSFLVLDKTQVSFSHRFFTVEAAALKEVVDRYCMKKHNSGSADTRGSPNKFNSLQENSSARANESKKRRRLNDDTESSDERSVQNDVKKGRKRLAEGSYPLACPFYKRDSKEYASCFQRNFSEINRVKQHLKRVHKRGAFCRRCREDFPSNQDLEAHVDYHMENAPCQKRIVDNSIALSEKTIDKLGKKADKNLSLFDQWYQVWDAIFPGVPRPPTCTVDPNLSASLIELQDFSERQGPQIIMNVLDRHNLRVSSCSHDIDQDKAALSALTNRVLAKANREIFDMWQAQKHTPISAHGNKGLADKRLMNRPAPSISSSNIMPDYLANHISAPTELEIAGVHPNIELAHSNEHNVKTPPQIGLRNESSNVLISFPQRDHSNIPLDREVFSGDGSELRDTMFQAFGQNETGDFEVLTFPSFPENTDWFSRAH